jgi:hypothetical protein
MKFVANISVTNEGNSFLSCDRSVSIGMRKLHIFYFELHKTWEYNTPHDKSKKNDILSDKLHTTLPTLHLYFILSQL